MNYKTVYDLKNKRFTLFYVLPIPFFVLSTAYFIIAVYMDYFSLIWEASFGAFACSFFLWFLINLFQMIADEQYIFKPYREGTCDVVEGMVSNITEKSRMHAEESFEVSGLRFVIPNASSKVGYHTLKKKGGVINHAGQNVRITYVYNKMLGNDIVIVKIETAEE